MANPEVYNQVLQHMIPTSFRVEIDRAAKTAYSCTRVNIPGVNIAAIPVSSQALAPLFFPAKPLTFNPFSMTFLLSEDLSNWIQIKDWMDGLSDAEGTKLIQKWIETQRSPYHADVTKIFSTIRLGVLSSKKNLLFSVIFEHAFPTSLADIQWNTAEANYEAVDCTFAYSHYHFE